MIFEQVRVNYHSSLTFGYDNSPRLIEKSNIQASKSSKLNMSVKSNINYPLLIKLGSEKTLAIDDFLQL
jgi:hypothetical protein